MKCQICFFPVTIYENTCFFERRQLKKFKKFLNKNKYQEKQKNQKQYHDIRNTIKTNDNYNNNNSNATTEGKHNSTVTTTTITTQTNNLRYNHIYKCMYPN